MFLNKNKRSSANPWLFSSILILIILLVFTIVGSMDQLPDDVTHKIEFAGGEIY